MIEGTIWMDGWMGWMVLRHFEHPHTGYIMPEVSLGNRQTSLAQANRHHI